MKKSSSAAVLDGEPVTEKHLERVREVARKLVSLHETPAFKPAHGYSSSLRFFLGTTDAAIDLLASGASPIVSRGRAEALERSFVGWRWKLATRADRLRSVHGEMNPRVLFDGDVSALAASAIGDVAIDLAPLAAWLTAVGLADPPLFRDGLVRVWDTLFVEYLGASGDAELLDVVPPFFARATLRLAAGESDALPRSVRVTLVDIAEEVLRRRALDPDDVVAMIRLSGRRQRVLSSGRASPVFATFRDRSRRNRARRWLLLSRSARPRRRQSRSREGQAALPRRFAARNER